MLVAGVVAVAVAVASGPARAAPAAERVARLAGDGRLDKAHDICERSDPDAEPSLREACADVDLQRLVAGSARVSPHALLRLAERWAGTGAASAARDKAGAQLLHDAGDDIRRLGSVWALLAGTEAAKRAVEHALKTARDQDGTDGLMAVVEHFPGTTQADVARREAGERAVASARAADTAQAWTAFLASWPSHPAAPEASERLVVLAFEAAERSGPVALRSFAQLHDGHPLAAQAAWKARVADLQVQVLDGGGNALGSLRAESEPMHLPDEARTFRVEAALGGPSSLFVRTADVETPLTSMRSLLLDAGLERALLPDVLDPVWTREGDALVVTLPALLCLPEGASALGLLLQEGEQAVRVSFLPPRSCPELVAWSRPSGRVTVDGKSVEFGQSMASFRRLLPHWKDDPHPGRFGRLCLQHEHFGAEACASFLADRLAWISLGCQLDRCYDQKSPYSTVKVDLVRPLGKGAVRRVDESTVEVQWARNDIWFLDRQYVGSESGDPSFDFTAAPEGVIRFMRAQGSGRFMAGADLPQR